MSQELDQRFFLMDFTEEDLKALNPVDAVETLHCQIEKITMKQSKTTQGQMNATYVFKCIDESNPEQMGRPAFKTSPFSKEFIRMHFPIICAALREDPNTFEPRQLNLKELEGKTLFIKFALHTDNRDGKVSVQPTDFFRDDKTPF